MRRALTYISQNWGEEGIFFSLFSFPLLAMIGFGYSLLRLVSGFTTDQHPYLFFAAVCTIEGFLLIVAGTISVLWIALFTAVKPPFRKAIRKVTVSLLFPLTIFVGHILRIPREKIQKSFLEVNNKLIQTDTPKVAPEKILLLLPRCIQKSSCTIGLAPDGRNCQRCNGCEIGKLWEIVDRHQVRLAIARGGEVARKFIRDDPPEAVVAVACTKEMIVGIQDTCPLLVLSILNEWPNGPCIDTTANLDEVEEAIRFFLGHGPSTERTV